MSLYYVGSCPIYNEVPSDSALNKFYHVHTNLCTTFITYVDVNFYKQNNITIRKHVCKTNSLRT